MNLAKERISQKTTTFSQLAVASSIHKYTNIKRPFKNNFWIPQQNLPAKGLGE